MSYKKYYVYKKQYTTDGVTWADVTPVEWTPSGDPIGTYDTFEQCGENPPQYRTRCDGNYYCNGYDKYINTITEISFDNGSTWEPANTSGSTLVERNCSDCISGIKVLTQSNCGNTITTNCGGTSALLNDDIPYVQSTNIEQYTSHTIGNCVTTISSYNPVTKLRNRNLKVCHLPSTISKIPNELFKGSGLEDFTIPSSITTIGDAVFSACTSLQSLKVLATTPPRMGNNVFDGTNIGQIYVPSESVNAYKFALGWSDFADKIFAIIDTCSARYRYVNECWVCQGYDKYHKAKQQVSYDGGETWTDTGVVSAMTLEEANSFVCGYGAPNPTSHYYYAEYSDGTRYAYDTDCDYTLTSAEANPKCYDSTKMTYAYVGGCYNEIGMGAFYEDTSLSSVTIDSIRYIGNSAFYGCSSLTSVTINAYSIGWDAFKNCTSLQYIAMKTSTPPTLNSFGGVFVNTNNCPIYVPSGSVATYKSASGWTGYADRIQATPSTYRWVDKGDYTCVGYDKYNALTQQVSYDMGSTWEDTVNYSATTLVETNSTYCGYEIKYRTTSGTPYCNGYDRYVDVYSQVSYDMGSTWETTATTPTMIEAQSPACAPSYENQYLTFVALESGTFSYSSYTSSNVVSYSLDSGTTWTSLTVGTSSPTIQSGQKIMWKGNLTSNQNYGSIGFSSTGRFNIEGNVMSLLFDYNFASAISLDGFVAAFMYLFRGCSKLVNAENLKLPATTLSRGCYDNMFYNCTSLTTAPELPATTSASNCYYEMFLNCSSLTKIKCLLSSSSTQNQWHWVSGVAASGTFIKKSGSTWSTGINGIPSGWTVQEV